MFDRRSVTALACESGNTSMGVGPFSLQTHHCISILTVFIYLIFKIIIKKYPLGNDMINVQHNQMCSSHTGIVILILVSCGISFPAWNNLEFSGGFEGFSRANGRTSSRIPYFNNKRGNTEIKFCINSLLKIQF